MIFSSMQDGRRMRAIAVNPTNTHKGTSRRSALVAARMLRMQQGHRVHDIKLPTISIYALQAMLRTAHAFCVPDIFVC